MCLSQREAARSRQFCVVCRVSTVGERRRTSEVREDADDSRGIRRECRGRVGDGGPRAAVRAAHHR